MIKISFILPCYNVEPYITRCLDSLLMQDLPLDEYEIICVNDCSPDHLRDVVLDYQKRYPNIHLIEHTVNKTAGGARNTGLDVAQGKYIWFVDPDDMIVNGVVSSFYEKANCEDLDILFFNFQSDKHYEKKELVTLPSKAAMNGVSFLDCFFHNNLTGLCTIWRAIYKKDYLDSHGIRFPQIKSSQDVVFAWKSVLLANRVSSVQTIGYQYFIRENSTTGSKGRRKPDAALSASLLFPNELLGLLESISAQYQWISHYLQWTIKVIINDHSRNVLDMTHKSKKGFYDQLMPQSDTISRLSPYMNNNTLRIFNYHKPFFVWEISIELMCLKRQIKRCFSMKRVQLS